MNNELLFLIKKHADTLIEQTKIKPQETLEYKMKKQMQTFSFSPPINLVGEGKWLLAVRSFSATNSVFGITNENNSFSISKPGHWNSEDCEEFINRLKKVRSEDDIELHVKEVQKRGTRKEVEKSGHSLAAFDQFKSEIHSE